MPQRGAGVDHAALARDRVLRPRDHPLRRGDPGRGEPERRARPRRLRAGARGRRGRRPRASQSLRRRAVDGPGARAHRRDPDRHPEQAALRRQDLGLRPGAAVVRRHDPPAGTLPLRARHHPVQQPAVLRRRDPSAARGVVEPRHAAPGCPPCEERQGVEPDQSERGARDRVTGVGRLQARGVRGLHDRRHLHVGNGSGALHRLGAEQAPERRRVPAAAHPVRERVPVPG